ncbi:hypothetical protein [Pinibacter soli]|uniref:Uncharacterized protein n=1 Tax=Pinibacter soli TaxID=3044211 RepID=A0ABT6RHY1_9BACT|nr:hypothetical protein [Pinibacter soli]MDI3321437.1 hypothetical protein [Pinibacter soli]
MRTGFYIIINIKTCEGIEPFGTLEIGKDRVFARRLFGLLKGRPVNSDEGVIHLDLMETKDGLPMNLEVLYCTLAELGENMQIITKEVFKCQALQNGRYQ